MWRNWYTRTIQNRMEQSLEVQILSCPQSKQIYLLAPGFEGRNVFFIAIKNYEAGSQKFTSDGE